MLLHVDEDLAWLEVLWEFFHGSVSCNLVHVFDLFLGALCLDFTLIKSDLEISLFEFVKAHLIIFTILHIVHSVLLVSGLRSQSGALLEVKILACFANLFRAFLAAAIIILIIVIAGLLGRLLFLLLSS